MKPETIIELNSIREDYFWNGIEANIDWDDFSNEAREFVENNKNAMYSTKETYVWVKENFGLTLTPFQIQEVNARGNVRDVVKDSYERIYGDTKSILG